MTDPDLMLTQVVAVIEPLEFRTFSELSPDPNWVRYKIRATKVADRVAFQAEYFYNEQVGMFRNCLIGTMENDKGKISLLKDGKYLVSVEADMIKKPHNLPIVTNFFSDMIQSLARALDKEISKEICKEAISHAIRGVISRHNRETGSPEMYRELHSIFNNLPGDQAISAMFKLADFERKIIEDSFYRAARHLA